MNCSSNEKSREYENGGSQEYTLFNLDVNPVDRDKFNFQSDSAYDSYIGMHG